jgi:hypothetical protein
MEVQYRLRLGNDEFTLKFEVGSEKELFEKASFFCNLPKVGPNGEDDLKLRHVRIKNFDYYSVVSEKADQEFKFGIRQSDKGLFPKGWAPLFHGQSDEEGTGGAPVIGGPVVGAPVQAQAPLVGASVTPQTVVAPQPSAAIPTPAAVTPTPQIQAAANDILARFMKQGK